MQQCRRLCRARTKTVLSAVSRSNSISGTSTFHVETAWLMLRRVSCVQITRFPADSRIHNGNKFWSGVKRFPVPVIRYDPTNSLHVMFVSSTATLYATSFGLVPASDVSLSQLQSTEFVNSVVRALPIPDLRDLTGAYWYRRRYDCEEPMETDAGNNILISRAYNICINV